MEKIIVRGKRILGGYTTGASTIFFEGERYPTTESILEKYDFNELMGTIFLEELTGKLEDSSLYKAYEQAAKTGEDNDYFKIMYQCDEEFAVHLSDQINVYHLLEKDEAYLHLIPWYYADSVRYMGDTWWEEDPEIIDNIKKLTLIEFMKVYRAY